MQRGVHHQLVLGGRRQPSDPRRRVIWPAPFASDGHGGCSAANGMASSAGTDDVVQQPPVSGLPGADMDLPQTPSVPATAGLTSHDTAPA